MVLRRDEPGETRGGDEDRFVEIGDVLRKTKISSPRISPRFNPRARAELTGYGSPSPEKARPYGKEKEKKSGRPRTPPGQGGDLVLDIPDMSPVMLT